MSADAAEFDFKARATIMRSENYERRDVVTKLMMNEVCAADTAIELNRTYMIMK